MARDRKKQLRAHEGAPMVEIYNNNVATTSGISILGSNKAQSMMAARCELTLVMSGPRGWVSGPEGGGHRRFLTKTVPPHH